MTSNLTSSALGLKLQKKDEESGLLVVVEESKHQKLKTEAKAWRDLYRSKMIPESAKAADGRE